MGFGNILSSTEVSASGLAAERLRMEVIANNIANANTTRSPQGGPYRRREVVFSTALASAADEGSGVHVVGVQADESPLPRVYRPGHPDADGDGMVTMPNVRLANEMVDLITASRAYEANLRSLRTFREMVEATLSLLERV